MTVLPTPVPVIEPVLDTVATPVFILLHMTAVFASAGSTVAVNMPLP